MQDERKEKHVFYIYKVEKNKDSFWQFKYANLLFEVKAFNIKKYDMFMILGHKIDRIENKIIFLIDFGKSLLLFNRFLTGIKATFKFLKYPEVSTCKHNMRFQKLMRQTFFFAKLITLICQQYLNKQNGLPTRLQIPRFKRQGA